MTPIPRRRSARLARGRSSSRWPTRRSGRSWPGSRPISPRANPCDDLPLDVRGTPFQQRVWAAPLGHPPGETRTYGEVAAEIGAAGAARAVGAACGANPVLILIPCHRVVGAGERARGVRAGLDRKRALLDLERP